MTSCNSVLGTYLVTAFLKSQLPKTGLARAYVLKKVIRYLVNGKWERRMSNETTFSLYLNNTNIGTWNLPMYLLSLIEGNKDTKDCSSV